MTTPRKSYGLIIALRYLLSRRSHRRISLNTAISVGGVALGVMSLLVVLSVMSGFQEDLRNKILDVNSNIVIFDYNGAITNPATIDEGIKSASTRVVASSRFVLGQAMAAFDDRAHGISLKGIDPHTADKTSELKKHMKEGRFDDLAEKDGVSGIVIGRELSVKLGAFVGDSISVISPMGKMGPMGILPKAREFRVSGIFEVGMFEYDSNLAIVGIKEAQEFLDMGEKISGIDVRIDDPFKVATVRESLSRRFPDLHVKDWMQMNKNLFSALKLEKLAMFVVLTLIVLVAAFNIISTLTMTVIEKESEIAILRAMGATRKGIMTVFVYQGFIIGLTGTLIGLAGGLLLCHLIGSYKLIELPADVYYLSHLPVKMNLSDFLTVCVSAILISFASTIYPAFTASKLNPVEPLRYE